MKALTSSAMIVCTLTASSQVVFDLPTAIPPYSTVDHGLWVSSDTIITVGQNITWDFTATLVDTGDVKTFIDTDPSTTSGAFDFPASTHAHGEVMGSDTLWNYYRLGIDTLWREGARYPSGDLFTCSDPNLIFFFPYSIGDLALSGANCVYWGTPVYVSQGLVPVATGTILYPGGMLTDMILMEFQYNGSPGGEYFWYNKYNCLTQVGHYVQGSLSLWIPQGPAGISDAGVNAPLMAYPSPAQEEVFVHVRSANGDLPYALLEAIGRLVLSGTARSDAGRLRVDVSSLTDGHYTLRIGDDVVRHARVIVAR